MARPEWFAAKRWGYGASVPITWQGWLVFLAYFLLLLAATRWLHPPSPAFWIAFAASSAGFVAVTYFTTKGGWRWRWGDDD